MMEKNGEGFIDRSKVKILLCDNDAKSSQEIFTLLTKCSYQVISVRSPRQVIDALNAERGDIDIILSELDLPMSRGSKMLRYIMRDKELRRIPIIMMSERDEVSTVVKCLKFGAADYLVKPLRINELLNLWTHMWRRRRMLGLSEKNIMTYDFDLVVSDPSDANTNSTTLFSDDTDDRSWKSVHPDTCVSNLQEGEVSVVLKTTFSWHKNMWNEDHLRLHMVLLAPNGKISGDCDYTDFDVFDFMLKTSISVNLAIFLMY